jgi:hypothetical protein
MAAVSLQSDVAPASSSMRWNAWLLIATFLLWVVTFLSIVTLLGDGPPPPPQTAAEAVQQIDAVRVANLLGIALANVAMLAGVVPLIRLGQQLRSSRASTLATLGLLAAIVAIALLVFHSYLRGGLSFAYPPNYPPLVDRVELYATNPISDMAMIVWTIAVVALSACLARLAILRRTGWVVSAVGIILALLMIGIGFGIPFVPALLSMALGVGLLRRKA